MGEGPARIAERAEAAAKVVIGAAIEVHGELGPGYLESVYEQALCVELSHRGIPFHAQVAFDLNYKGVPVGAGCVDLIVDDCLVVELKAVDEIHPLHLAQTLSYLKATRIRLALIINFNVREAFRRPQEGGSLNSLCALCALCGS